MDGFFLTNVITFERLFEAAVKPSLDSFDREMCLQNTLRNKKYYISLYILE